MRVCLIHGSTQGPHGWDLMAKELMAWGVEVVAVDLPCVPQGAAYFAAEVAKQMPPGQAPIVVAHSAAGLVLPLVAECMPVTGLVYLAALVPQPGASLVDRFQRAPEMFQPGWPGKDSTRVPDLAQEFLFHDCEPRVNEWALTTLRLWASAEVMREPSPLVKHPAGIPTTYLSAGLDRTLRMEWWEPEAERLLGVQPVRIEAGHAPHVSRPREVAKLILRLAG